MRIDLILSLIIFSVKGGEYVDGPRLRLDKMCQTFPVNFGNVR